MAGNVRRLIFDMSFVQWLPPLFYGLMVAASDALWLGQPEGTSPITYAIMLTAFSLASVGKIPVWRILPLSRHDLGQTQWWALVGRPLILAVMAMTLAIVISIFFGALQASSREIAAALSGQVALCVFVGCAVPLYTVARKSSGVWGGRAVNTVMTLCYLALYGRWLQIPQSRLEDHLPLRHPLEMMIAGAVSLVAMAWLFLRPEILAEGIANRPKRESRLVRRKALRPASSHMRKGLPGMFTTYALIIARVGGGFFLFFLVAGLACRWLFPFAVPWLFVSFPAIGFMMVVALQLVQSPRVMAGLPISAWQRTMILQLIGPAVQVLLFVLMIAAAFIVGQPVLSIVGGVPPRLFVASLALIAVTVPVSLRYGAAGVGSMIGWLMPAIMGGSGFLAVARPGLNTWTALVVIGLVLLLAAGWFWTFLELSRGHRAYRLQTRFPTRWGGRAG